MTPFELLNRVFADELREAPYVKCRHAHHWHRTGQKVLTECTPGMHEQYLIDFLEMPIGAAETAENLRLLLVGPAGSGKSTYIIRHVHSKLHELRSRCLVIDLKGLNEMNAEQVTPDLEKYFSLRIATALNQNHLHLDIEPLQLILNMWDWLSHQPAMISESQTLNQHLSKVLGRIRCIMSERPYANETKEQSLNFVSTAYDELEGSTSGYDSIWLAALKIAYKKSEGHYVIGCNAHDAIVLDNVDALPKALQLQAIHLSRALAEKLRCKTIVPIRPQTWKNVHLELGVNTVDHYCPDVSDVLVSRIDWAFSNLAKDLTEENIKTLNYLKKCLFHEERHPFGRMVLSAFSHNVRLALFSISNMAETELLRFSSLHDLTVMQLAYAFFLGERGALDRDRVEDLYAVGGLRKGIMLVKPRIIDYLSRIAQGSATRTEIVRFLSRFGIASAQANAAIDELSQPLRPLIWTNDDTKPQSDQSFCATEVGLRYVEGFFGELFYDQVSTYESRIAVGGRERPRDILPAQVIERHRQLCSEDFNGILEVINRSDGGVDFVRRHYPFDSMLCVVHWRKLQSGLDRISATYLGTIDYDPERVNLLRRIYDHLLEQRQIPNELQIDGG